LAGTIIADKIQTENALLTLNVGQTQVASINSGGIYGATGVKLIGSDGSITQSNTLYVGANASSTVGGATNPIIGAILSANNYVQNYIYNPSNTALASADIACYPSNGSDANGWIDMGITSNAYSYSAYPITGRNEGYILMSAPGNSGTSGNLVFATDSTGLYNSIQFYNGGFSKAKSNTSATINQYGLGLGTAVPTSGVGIAFPGTQSASSDANTLDDYEEGTWTPVATSGGGSITTYSSNGVYTKIGRTVTIFGSITTTTVGTASGTLNFSGLPFATLNSEQYVGLSREAINTGANHFAVISTSSGYLQSSTGGAITWSNGNSYRFTVTYQAT
jgi:hypothetical protein